MSTLSMLAALLAVELAAIAYGAWQRTPTALRAPLLLNMILIALFAPKLFALGEFSSNVGSIFYAAVFTIQCVVFRCWGPQAAFQNIWFIVPTMITFYLLSWLLGSMVAIGPSDQTFTMLVFQFTNNYTLVSTGASLLAFVAAQLALIKLLTLLVPTGMPYAVALAVIGGQIVDSLIFYPLVFHSTPFRSMAIITVAGFITKIVCGLLLTPAYLYAVYEREGT